MSARHSIASAAMRPPWAEALIRRRASLAIGATLLGTMILAWAAGEAVSTASHRLQQAQAAQRRSAADLAAAQVQDTRLQPALERLKELEARGATGPAQRSQWQRVVAQSLSPATEPRSATAVRATFSPPRALAGSSTSLDGNGRAAPVSPGQPLRLMATTLQLSAELRHEGALLRLLSSLEAERSAIVITRNCSMERLAEAGAADAATGVRATCTIDWLTLEQGAAEDRR